VAAKATSTVAGILPLMASLLLPFNLLSLGLRQSTRNFGALGPLESLAQAGRSARLVPLLQQDGRPAFIKSPNPWSTSAYYE